MKAKQTRVGTAQPRYLLKTLSAALCGSLLCGTAFAAEHGDAAGQTGQSGMQQTGQSGMQQAGQSGMKQGLPAPYRLSTWMGKTVQNDDGEKLGKVKEMVMDDYGVVRYVILQRSGSGMDDQQLVAVPLGHFNYRTGKSPALMIDAATAHMQGAPGFAGGSWPNMGDPSWNAVVISYWVSPEAAQRMEQSAREGGSKEFEANRDMVYLSEERDALFSKLDQNNDSVIVPKEAEQHDRLAQEFDRIDTFSNDRITRSEFSMFEVKPEDKNTGRK